MHVFDPSDDTALLHTLANEFFALYAKEDLEGFMLLWSAQSPDFAFWKQRLQEVFAANEKIEVKGLAVRKVTVEGEKASLRVVVEMTAIDAKSGQPSAGFGHLQRTLDFVKEGGAWKVWRYVPAADELAASLIAAKTEEERGVLLSKERELVTKELPQALNARGKRLEERGNRSQALIAYHLSQSIAEQIGDQAGVAVSLSSIGWFNYVENNYAQALEYYKKSLTLSEAVGNKLGSAWTLDLMGDVYRDKDNFALALQYHKRALGLAEEVGDKQLLSEIHLMLGLDYGGLGNVEEPLKLFQKSLILSQQAGDKNRIANARIKIANFLRFRGNTTEAMENAKKAVVVYEELGHKRGISFAVEALGEIYRIQGDYAQALECFQRNLALNEELGNKTGFTEALNKIGLVHYWQGDYAQALGYFQKALTRSQQTGTKYMIARAMSHLGQTYSRLADYPRAIEYNLAAFSLREALEDKQGMADTAGNLGDVLQLQGNYPQAMIYLQRSLSLSQEIGAKRDAAFALKGMALIYCKQGKYEQALESASRAITLAKEIGSREYLWDALTSAGRAHRALDHLALARESLEEAIITVERLRSNVAGQQTRATYFANVQAPYELYIDLLMELHKRRPSEGYDALALHASERARARSLLEILTEAGANIRQGVNPQLLQRERSLQQQLNARAERQTRLSSNKHTEEQVTAAAQEIDALTKDYQQVEVEIRQSSPRYAALTQPQPLTTDEIQRDLLDADTALLEYALGEDRSYLWLVTPTSLKSFELPKRAEIETSVRRVVELVSNGKRWATGVEINSEYETAAAHLSSTLLPQGLLSQMKAKHLVIVGDGALQYLPFGALPSPKSTVHSPQSTVRRLTSYGQPLVVDYEIVSLPSASTLAVLRHETANRARATRSVAVLADPVFEEGDERVKTEVAQTRPSESVKPSLRFSDSSFNRAASSRGLLERAFRVDSQIATDGSPRETLRIGRLPFTRFEAEGILAAAPPNQSFKATDFRANRETATSADLANYRYVHFATHGILNSEHPELSGIVLSLVNEKGEPVDGFLRLHEIYNLNLPADLVVLSACQTGLGKEIRGEGLVGLTRGFMYAGAPRVVASLWKVDDAATAELMRRFYSGMLKDNLRPAAALRRAKVEMWKQKRWQSPFYWAAFELQGEWR